MICSKQLLLCLIIASVSAIGHAEFKDPTKPDYPLPAETNDKVTPIAENNLVLSAIWLTATSKRATINGVTAKQGQTILQGVKLLNITRNTVTINNNGRLQTLRLLKSPYKTK